MDAREMLVSKVIKVSFNWVVGGYENSIQDGEIETMPDHDSLLYEIYNHVIDTKQLTVRGGFIPVKSDIKFLTKIKIESMIEEILLKNDL